jgi:DNA/RNA endonuclease G (NUC1)
VYEQNHLTIGNNKVGVPTKLWKVIIDRKTAKVISFIFPNEALPVRDLPKYVTTVKAIELETKINFMPQLPEGMQKIEITPPVLSDWSGL